MNFEAWKKEITALSLPEYSYDFTESPTEEDLAGYYAEGETPAEFVAWWGEKYDLERYI